MLERAATERGPEPTGRCRAGPLHAAHAGMVDRRLRPATLHAEGSRRTIDGRPHATQRRVVTLHERRLRIQHGTRAECRLHARLFWPGDAERAAASRTDASRPSARLAGG